MKKLFFTFAATGLCALAFNSCGSQTTVAEQKSNEEIVLENIHARKSVRSYTAQAVEEEKVDKLVRAGMAAPTGRDARPWEVVVLNERATLDKLAEGLPYAKMLAQAPLAIVVCGDVSKQPEYWFVDCSAMTENILLAAEAMGLGAVWTAAYPYPDREAAVTAVLGLPENVRPLCVIPIGYPAGDEKPKDKYDTAKIHYNKW